MLLPLKPRMQRSAPPEEKTEVKKHIARESAKQNRAYVGKGHTRYCRFCPPGGPRTRSSKKIPSSWSSVGGAEGNGSYFGLLCEQQASSRQSLEHAGRCLQTNEHATTQEALQMEHREPPATFTFLRLGSGRNTSANVSLKQLTLYSISPSLSLKWSACIKQTSAK